MPPWTSAERSLMDMHVPAQPGSAKEARRMLPLGAFGSYLFLGGIFCVLATLAFAWLAKGIFANHFVGFDDAVITWLHGRWGPANDQIMLAFTTLGDPLVLGIFVVLAAFALWRRGRWIDAVGIVVATGGAGILNQL